jgi:hypothetical protein
LQLGKEQVKARLRAYLYEKGVALETSRGSSLIAEQLDHISDLVDAFYNLSSEKAKNEALPSEAKAAALQLYLLIGEIARLTRLEPIRELSAGV